MTFMNNLFEYRPERRCNKKKKKKRKQLIIHSSNKQFCIKVKTEMHGASVKAAELTQLESFFLSVLKKQVSKKIIIA